MHIAQSWQATHPTGAAFCYVAIAARLFIHKDRAFTHGRVVGVCLWELKIITLGRGNSPFGRTDLEACLGGHCPHIFAFPPAKTNKNDTKRTDGVLKPDCGYQLNNNDHGGRAYQNER
ncbi:MAG: hypothetical protein ABJD13_15325 [Paracoccaceae bacterium]